MEVTICGARGSTPAPGAEFLRYGGHTSCLAIAHEGEAPHLLLDAGTGIRRVTAMLAGEPFIGTILLGHLHWDHTQGIPFFPAGDRPDARVTVCVPADGDPEAALEKMMSVPNFPITPRQLRGEWSFVALEPGRHEFEGFEVLALEIPHKGGRTFGYRVSDGASSIAYLSDHCPISLGPGPHGLGEYHEAALSLAAGVDVLIHDAQYTDAELPGRASWGTRPAATPWASGRRPASAGSSCTTTTRPAPTRRSTPSWPPSPPPRSRWRPPPRARCSASGAE